jgi:thymidine kinase
LIPHAEEVERLTAFCSVCCDGTVATYSQYTGATSEDDIIIGGAEVYRPVCRKHYLQ